MERGRVRAGHGGLAEGLLRRRRVRREPRQRRRAPSRGDPRGQNRARRRESRGCPRGSHAGSARVGPQRLPAGEEVPVPRDRRGDRGRDRGQQGARRGRAGQRAGPTAVSAGRRDCDSQAGEGCVFRHRPGRATEVFGGETARVHRGHHRGLRADDDARG